MIVRRQATLALEGFYAEVLPARSEDGAVGLGARPIIAVDPVRAAMGEFGLTSYSGACRCLFPFGALWGVNPDRLGRDQSSAAGESLPLTARLLAAALGSVRSDLRA